MANSPRFFTVEEANQLLPEVRRLLDALRRAVSGLEKLQSSLGGSPEENRPQPDTRVDPHHFRLVSGFHRALEGLTELGVEVKDVREGLVDFPAIIGKKEVRLCWKEGEERVAHYHDRSSGFAGRKPLPPPGPADSDPEE